MTLSGYENNPPPNRRQNHHPVAGERGQSVKTVKNTDNYALTRPTQCLLSPGKDGVTVTSALSNPAKTARIFSAPSPKPFKNSI